MTEVKLKVGQLVFIISSATAAVAGGNVYEVEIVSFSGNQLCELKTPGNENNFVGDVRSLFLSKKDAIDALIDNLQLEKLNTNEN